MRSRTGGDDEVCVDAFGPGFDAGDDLLDTTPAASNVEELLVAAPVTQAAWREVAELPPTARGAGGLGSTGT
jgi:hypothetical protein